MTRRRIELGDGPFAADAAAGRFKYAELAARHGISVSHVRKLIGGTRRPHVSEIDRGGSAPCRPPESAGRGSGALPQWTTQCLFRFKTST